MSERWLMVRAGGQRLAVALDEVQEVVGLCAATVVDDDGVRAVINLRGQVVSLVEAAGRGPMSPSRFVLVASQGEFGVLVDDVLQLVELGQERRSTGDGPLFVRADDGLVRVLSLRDAWSRRGARVTGGGEDTALTAAEAALLESRARRYATDGAQVVVNTVDFLDFIRFEQSFAIPLAGLVEISRVREVAALPGASRRVPGVLHAQGHIVSAHDLGACLDLDGDAGWRWAVVVGDDDHRLALLADDVVGIRARPATAAAPAPLALTGRVDFVGGRFPDGALALSLDRLLTSDALHAPDPLVAQETR